MQSRKFPESVCVQEGAQKMTTKFEKEPAVSTNMADAEQGNFDHSYEEMVCTKSMIKYLWLINMAIFLVCTFMAHATAVYFRLVVHNHGQSTLHANPTTVCCYATCRSSSVPVPVVVTTSGEICTANFVLEYESDHTPPELPPICPTAVNMQLELIV